MNRTRIAIVGLALVATACTSGNTSGTPTPGTPTTETQASTFSNNSNKLAGLKPCELITTGEAAPLGLASPKADNIAGSESCDWSNKDGGLTVVINPDQGADGYNYSGSTKAPGKFGSYDGYKVEAPKGTAYLCDVVIAVTDSSSVQIVGSASPTSTDTAQACELATKSAELVAAKL